MTNMASHGTPGQMNKEMRIGRQDKGRRIKEMGTADTHQLRYRPPGATVMQLLYRPKSPPNPCHKAQVQRYKTNKRIYAPGFKRTMDRGT